VEKDQRRQDLELKIKILEEELDGAVKGGMLQEVL
jgi:hypothetical protein